LKGRQATAQADNGDGTDTITPILAPDIRKFARLKVVITP
jgi:hypothetical protein